MTKDVDLVIRAKNEASRVLEQIVKSLDGFVSSTDKVAGSATKTGSVLENLKREIDTLNQGATNLAGFGKITAQLDRATDAVKRLEGAVEKGDAELSTLTKGAADAAGATERLAGLTRAATETLKAQKAAISATKAEIAAETAEINKLENALGRVAKLRSGKGDDLRNSLPGSTAQQAAAVLLQGEKQAAEQRKTAAQKRLEDQTTSLQATKTAVEQFGASQDAAGDRSRKLAVSLDAATGALRRNQEQLATARAALAETQETAARASAAFGGIPASAEAVAAARARVAASQAEAKARIETLTKAKPEAAVTASAPLAARAKANAKAVAEAASAEAQKLGRALSAAEQPSEELAAAFGRAAAQSQLAKRAYLEQAEALTKLRGATFAAFSQRVTAEANPVDPNAAQAAALASARLAASQAQAKARIEALTAARPESPVRTSAPLVARAKANAKAEYEAATAEVQRLARATKEAEQPTEELAIAFGRAIAQARLTKQAYLEQSEALVKLRGNSFAAFSQRVDQARAPVRPEIQAPAAPAPPIAQQTLWRTIAQEARAAGDALKGDGTAGANSFRDALKGIYGDSRESLSLMQRLRGEVLGLAAAYVGFQAAISGASRVIDTFRNLEAVQNRLGSVFNQDTTRVGQEVSYLQREATRLGVSFSTLADEYGKFNIAAKAANMESQDTRRIFMSVAEAGRVNKLSNDQLSGVFLALTQMMSKGKIQSEELRRQLGDRLPGAFSIMAKAIGVTESELDNLMQEGKVLASSDNMLAFAAELDKRFGSQLSAALMSTTTEIGRFQNSLEQAMITVANGGFIDGFTNMLRTLNAYFASDEGRKFFLSLGSAAGTFFNALAALIPYANEFRYALMALIAVKIAGALTSMGAVLISNISQIRAAVGATTTLTGSQRVLAASTAALQVELTKAQIGLEMLSATGGIAGARFAVLSAAVGVFGRMAAIASTAARGLLAAFGGIPGLIVTGLTVAAGAWLTSVDKTTEALGEHKALIDAVVSKYEDAKNRTADWAKEIKGASSIQVSLKIADAEQQLDDIRKSVVAPADYFGSDRNGTVGKIREAIQAFKEGSLSAADYKTKINSIAEADPKLNRNLVQGLLDAADKAVSLEDSLNKLKAVLALMKGEATDAQKKLLGLGEALKDNGAPKAAADMKAFGDALEALKAKIPALAVELKKLKDSTENLDALEKAVNAAGGDPELIKKAYSLYDRANAATLDQETQGYVKQYGGEKIPLSLVKAIYGGEGYRGQAYRDVGGVPTIGFGSTRINGRPVEMGDSITKDEAVKQMVADLSKFAAMVDAAIGNVQINENQRNALVSYVYNTGNTDGNARTRAIFDAVRERKSDQEIANLIAGGVNTVNGTPNAGLTNRRAAEAQLYLRPVDRSTGTAEGPTEYDIEKQKREAQNNFDKTIREQTEKSERNAANQNKINKADSESAAKREIAIQNALIEAQNKAREAGVTISDQQIERIKSTTAAEYDAMHVTDQAKEAEEKVNALYKLRQQLLEELKVAKEQGDQTQVATTAQSIEKVNEQLREAIRLAIEYWQKIGGTDADAAIAKLRLQEAQTERNKTAILTAGRANDMLASGMVRGFSDAADHIGKAIAGTESWGDALRGVGAAFMQFAADFLREIAQMILKQLILNAISSAMGMPGGVGGGIAGFANALVGTAHTGGLVGSSATGGNPMRHVNPTWFQNAARYHGGGVAGLQPGEVPTILKQNEEVLTTADPRHMFNGGGKGGAGGPSSIKSVLVMDPAIIPDAMASSEGEQVIMTTIKSNKATIRQMLDKG